MKCKQIFAGVAAVLASSGAMASNFNGNASVVSNYMFRGIDQSLIGTTPTGGAAVQGGVDYGFDIGAYTGVWVTNSAIGGGNEADVYGGYGIKLGEFDLDAGLIYYAYTEDTEAPGAPNMDYAEIYVGGALGPAAVKVFYTNKFGKDIGLVTGNTKKDAALYATASVTLTLNDTISFTPQLGFSNGDGVKDAFGDNYVDYSITATKKLKDDLSVSLAVVGTNLKDFPAPGSNDNPKFVIGLKKNFGI